MFSHNLRKVEIKIEAVIVIDVLQIKQAKKA